jgi:hypothetical protein
MSMQPTTRGLVVLAAAAILWSCSGDPTDVTREGPPRILADPSALFLSQGDSAFVQVQLADSQGNQLDADFQAAAASGALTVTEDAEFLPVPGGSLLTQARFNVLANTSGVTSLTVTAAGASLEVPVRVIPTALADATFSNPAPAANEPVTVTAPGFIFSGVDTVAFDGIRGIVLSVAEDGSSVTILPPPGTTAAATINGVSADFLPDVPLSLTTTATLAVAPATSLPGTGSTATAPEIVVPALNESASFYDAGVFTAPDITGDGGVGAQYYTFTVTEAGDYRFVTDWPNTSDIDPFVCFDAACAAGEAVGTLVDQPEDGTLTLEPGTYYFASVLFGGAVPPNFSLTITHSETVAE